MIGWPFGIFVNFTFPRISKIHAILYTLIFNKKPTKLVKLQLNSPEKGVFPNSICSINKNPSLWLSFVIVIFTLKSQIILSYLLMKLNNTLILGEYRYLIRIWYLIMWWNNDWVHEENLAYGNSRICWKMD
jgi:hypothetical protein